MLPERAKHVALLANAADERRILHEESLPELISSGARPIMSFMQSPGEPPPATALDAIVPSNPLAAVACWSGVFSIITCYAGAVLGPLAVILGVMSLKRGALAQQSSYGKATSTARSWIGIVTGILGTLAGIGWIATVLLQR